MNVWNFIVLNFSKMKCHKTAHSKRYAVGSLWPVAIYFIKSAVQATGTGASAYRLVGLGDLRKNQGDIEVNNMGRLLQKYR